jgi:hypothetical protein
VLQLQALQTHPEGSLQLIHFLLLTVQSSLEHSAQRLRLFQFPFQRASSKGLKLLLHEVEA